MMDSDGFQLVSKKKAARRKYFKNPDATLHSPQETVNESLKKILRAKDALQSSQGYTDFINSLKKIDNHVQDICDSSLIQDHKISGIVCYGIGLPSCSRIARYQTALLLILKDRLSVSVEVYDPVFTSVDIEVLENFGLKILIKNEEGKRKVKGVTIFFMPHCGKELYNNLLWANWNPAFLPMCVIIGNSFSSIVQNVPGSILKCSYQFIYKTESLCKEYRLKSLVEYDDVFNDLSIHILPREIAYSKAKDFWLQRTEPQYEGCDVEIVRKKY